MPNSPPRYYRVQIILSDVDADLKEWLWKHPRERSSAMRAALRAWLATNGGTPPRREPNTPPTGGTSGAPRQTAVTSQPAPADVRPTPEPTTEPGADTDDGRVQRLIEANKGYF